jgi:hypothetical protein
VAFSYKAGFGCKPLNSILGIGVGLLQRYSNRDIFHVSPTPTSPLFFSKPANLTIVRLAK